MSVKARIVDSCRLSRVSQQHGEINSPLLKLLPTDESTTTVGRTSKTTVGRTTSDGIVDLLSEEEEDESDEKEGSISRRQLEGKLRRDMAQQLDGNSK